MNLKLNTLGVEYKKNDVKTLGIVVQLMLYIDLYCSHYICCFKLTEMLHIYFSGIRESVSESVSSDNSDTKFFCGKKNKPRKNK